VHTSIAIDSRDGFPQPQRYIPWDQPRSAEKDVDEVVVAYEDGEEEVTRSEGSECVKESIFVFF
jgi:hypothetical protein